MNESVEQTVAGTSRRGGGTLDRERGAEAATRLRDLGAKCILVQAAERGYITEMVDVFDRQQREDAFRKAMDLQVW